MKLKRLLLEIQNESVVNSSLKKIHRLILSSSNSGLSFSNDELNFLNQTVDGRLTLYRGIGLIYSRVSTEDRKIVNKVQVGDETPEFLLGSLHDHGIMPYTKSLTVAKHYMEGEVSIVIETTVEKNNVVCDLSNLEKLIKKLGINQSIFDTNDFAYMKREKEVLVRNAKTLPSKIAIKKGWFRF